MKESTNWFLTNILCDFFSLKSIGYYRLVFEPWQTMKMKISSSVFNSWQSANNFQVLLSRCNILKVALKLFIWKMKNFWKYFEGTGRFTLKLELTIKTLGNTLTQATRSMHWRQFGRKLSFTPCYWLKADSRSHSKRANSLTFPFFSHNSCHFDFSFN